MNVQICPVHGLIGVQSSVPKPRFSIDLELKRLLQTTIENLNPPVVRPNLVRRLFTDSDDDMDIQACNCNAVFKNTQPQPLLAIKDHDLAVTQLSSTDIGSPVPVGVHWWGGFVDFCPIKYSEAIGKSSFRRLSEFFGSPPDSAHLWNDVLVQRCERHSITLKNALTYEYPRRPKYNEMYGLQETALNPDVHTGFTVVIDRLLSRSKADCLREFKRLTKQALLWNNVRMASPSAHRGPS